MRVNGGTVRVAVATNMVSNIPDVLGSLPMSSARILLGSFDLGV